MTTKKHQNKHDQIRQDPLTRSPIYILMCPGMSFVYISTRHVTELCVSCLISLMIESGSKSKGLVISFFLITIVK